MRAMRTLITLTLCSALTSGCIFGPSALQRSRGQYNAAVQRTQAEQLLLNLVRLRYHEAPLFLEIATITTQFTFDAGTGVDGEIVEGSGGDVLTLSGNAAYSERPTINLQPLQGSDFAQRLLSPIEGEKVAALIRSGWSIDRVLRLCANQINGVPNAPSATGPTPSLAPTFRDFARGTASLRDLQRVGALSFGLISRSSDVSPPLDHQSVSASDMIQASSQGLRFEERDEGRRLVLTTSSRGLQMQIDPAVLGHSDMPVEFVEIFQLVPGRSVYSVSGSALAPGTRGPLDTLNIEPRSLLGTLFYLSNAVQVPLEHQERGLVTFTVDNSGTPFDWNEMTGDLLRVHSGAWPPVNAAVAVEHRGYWYWIDDNDLTSKSTFALLSQLFALQAGGADAAAPVLTIPVGS